MKYIEFKDRLKDFTVFSLSDIRIVTPRFHRRRLNEWQSKGYLQKIIKGYYIFSDTTLNENSLFEIANRIYTPSYISFEMALSYYNLLPESVYGITSASTRRTYSFQTPIAHFSYKTLKPTLFFGYDLIPYNHKHFKIASPEKALLDYFYLHSTLKTKNDFMSLRVNKELFLKRLNEKKIKHFLKKFNQKTLTQRITAFLEYLKHA